MSAIIWVHLDALSRDHPVFAAAPDGARAIHVWDAEDLARRGWSLKRCVFVLECLQEMDVEIVKGRPRDIFDAMGADAVFTAATPDPSFRRVIDELGERATVVDAPTFAHIPQDTDMGRFFRYWNKAKRSALRKDG